MSNISQTTDKLFGKGNFGLNPNCGISLNDAPFTVMHKLIACFMIIVFACVLALCIFLANHLLLKAFPQLARERRRPNANSHTPVPVSVELPFLNNPNALRHL